MQCSASRYAVQCVDLSCITGCCSVGSSPSGISSETWDPTTGASAVPCVCKPTAATIVVHQAHEDLFAKPVTIFVESSLSVNVKVVPSSWLLRLQLRVVGVPSGHLLRV